MLLFCIKYYRGDDKIKSFIFDLIAPSADGEGKVSKNHAGLSAPVPRGRKGKKKLKEVKAPVATIEGAEWSLHEKYDPEVRDCGNCLFGYCFHL